MKLYTEQIRKTYRNRSVVDGVSIEVSQGEIVGLLGPNGAGKTTLISTICGIISPSSGSVTVDGFDIISDFRKTRSMIGLVPQELTLGSFDTVWSTVRFSRGLFGSKRDDAYLEQLLKDLSLFDKKDSEIATKLSELSLEKANSSNYNMKLMSNQDLAHIRKENPAQFDKVVFGKDTVVKNPKEVIESVIDQAVDKLKTKNDEKQIKRNPKSRFTNKRHY